MKNEAWALDRFLRCASRWADHIIIADQCSDDGSRQIALRHPKVTLVENRSAAYNEPERQKLLIDAARRIPGKRLIVALDADEVLTANYADHPEWQAVLSAPEGTVVYFEWANVLPGAKSCWLAGYHQPFGFMDNGSEHDGPLIHSFRVPTSETFPSLRLRDIKVLHYQYADWDRMKSKQRWYQCYETLTYPDKSALSIYRMYHHMDAIARKQIQPLSPAWLRAYQQSGIDMATVNKEPFYRWDKEVLDWFVQHGPGRFRKLAVWHVDWVAISRKIGVDADLRTFRDPRTPLEKAVHRWLHHTQSQHRRRRVRVVENWLCSRGW